MPWLRTCDRGGYNCGVGRWTEVTTGTGRLRQDATKLVPCDACAMGFELSVDCGRVKFCAELESGVEQEWQILDRRPRSETVLLSFRSQTVMVRVGGGWQGLSKCAFPVLRAGPRRFNDQPFAQVYRQSLR